MHELVAKNCQRVTRCISLAFLFLIITACAGGLNAQNEVVFHSFQFDVSKDSPNAELIDYRYGSSRDVGVANPESQRLLGVSRQRAGMSGDMHRGDDLYVKWRLRDTGKVYEDTVDLKSRLPRSIKNQTIYFIIDGEQLYVYLISFDVVRTESAEEAERQRSKLVTPHQRAFYSYLGNSVVMIYPKSRKIFPVNSK